MRFVSFMTMVIFSFSCCVDSQRKIVVLAGDMRSGSGPFGVYQSVMKGFFGLGVSFQSNPREYQGGEDVLVLSGVENLRKAIELKRAGRIARLFAGPNVVNSPRDHNYLITQPEVDLCLVPSDWIRIAYEEDAPVLKGRIVVWAAGVDVDLWRPTEQKDTSVLVYWKTESELLCKEIEALVRKYGYVPVRVRYGAYTFAEYKKILQRSQFAVFISRSESQGVALAEAWSMNVPTLVFDPGTLTYLGRVYSAVSACPYLTEETGRTWKTIEQLDVLLKNISLHICDFHPRAWVLANMSNPVVAQKLIEMIAFD